MHQVILEHVAHDAGFLVILAARFHAHCLRCRDLDVRDPPPVPQWLEDRVCKPQHQYVLDGLLAEKVVDPVDLILGEQGQHERIQVARCLQAVAEWLLHDDACPWPRLWVVRSRDQPAAGEVPHDRLEHARRNGKVEEPVAILLRPRGLDLREPNLDLAVRRLVAGVAAHVEDALRKPLPHLVIHALDLLRLGQRSPHLLAEGLVGVRGVAAHAEYREAGREQVLGGELIECRKELALGEVSGRPENHHRALIGPVGRVSDGAELARRPRLGRDGCRHGSVTA